MKFTELAYRDEWGPQRRFVVPKPTYERIRAAVAKCPVRLGDRFAPWQPSEYRCTCIKAHKFHKSILMICEYEEYKVYDDPRQPAVSNSFSSGLAISR